ncbi:DUF3800 domain-containing protein (plasmid) [Alkalibacillus sp. S2W]|uniref:DUF3800 domain-containing protein n=1 Tax=Alkalibacillus sp. S2W TaxID=3386553 RepID=UPI00398D2F9F
MTSFNDIKIFFDESGKNGDEKPHLMGGMSIPQKIYAESSFYDDLLSTIKSTEIHWTNYGGHEGTKKAIQELITKAMVYSPILKMNVINYDQSLIQENGRSFSDTHEDISEATIYTKFPERIVYGLLRKRGKDSFTSADIIVEDANEYRKLNLDEQMKEQLNIQSLYRGEHFKIKSSDYSSKGEEPGLELTDVILGILRTIISNPTNLSGRMRKKIDLVMELLNNEIFFHFLTNIKYFEWNDSNELTEIDFNSYLQSFITQNFNLFPFKT